MQNLTRLLLFVLPAALFWYGCSSHKPAEFGNRKFYPNPSPKQVALQKALPVSPAQALSTLEPKTAEPEEKAQAVPSVQTLAGPDPSLAQRLEVARKSVSGKLQTREKPSFRERLALKVLSRSLQASGTETGDDDKRTPTSAILGFIFGLLGFLVAALLMGLLAVVFSAVALSKPADEYKRGLALAGLILGIICIVVGLIAVASAV